VLEENLPGENLASKPHRNKTQIDGSAKAGTHQVFAPLMF